MLLGVDIGGSGIKGALVDLEKGSLASERIRIPTPAPPTPDSVAGVVASLVQHFAWSGAIGCTFPGVVEAGKILTAANLEPSWIGIDGAELFGDATGSPVTVLNDADAAGIAEMKFGAGKDSRGVVLMLTLGTGVGSALFSDGQLVPNTEFGQILFRGGPAEKFVSDATRKKEALSWKEWAIRLGTFLNYLELLLWPELLIIGGGVSKAHDQFINFLSVRARVMPAELRNQAGIVGAALAADQAR